MSRDIENGSAPLEVLDPGSSSTSSRRKCDWGNSPFPWALVPYLLLLLTLGLGWTIARGGGFASTPLGRLEAVLVLTGPIFSSGIVFSTLVASRGTMAGIMAVNLLGAMLGGLLEYNSMYFGFQFLYLIAMVLYSLALMWELLPAKGVVPAPAGVDGG